MHISSADLMGTAAVAAQVAADYISTARNNSTEPMSALDVAESRLVQALIEVRAAKWGITRRMPQFDDQDLNWLLAAEAAVIHNSRGSIPAT